MKTAITELIEKLISFKDNPSSGMEINIDYFKQKEKEQIIDAFHINPKEVKWNNGSEYYNELYK